MMGKLQGLKRDPCQMLGSSDGEFRPQRAGKSGRRYHWSQMMRRKLRSMHDMVVNAHRVMQVDDFCSQGIGREYIRRASVNVISLFKRRRHTVIPEEDNEDAGYLIGASRAKTDDEESKE